MSDASSKWKAVPRVSAPDTSLCEVFDRGHHAHPVQVSMAMKRGADDGRFVTVVLDAADGVDVDGRSLTRVTLSPEDGEPLVLVSHDASLAKQLGRIQERTFVWEGEFGVLFPLTDQAREVLGTGAVTLAAEPLTFCTKGA
jgi:hypothetical protein